VFILFFFFKQKTAYEIASCLVGSEWYADGGPQPPDFAAKFLLGPPGLNRRSTIGFRCVVDLRT